MFEHPLDTTYARKEIQFKTKGTCSNTIFKVHLAEIGQKTSLLAFFVDGFVQ